MQLAFLGTGTGVGKTRAISSVAMSLRSRGRKVWLHKPVACGEWEQHGGVGSSGDGRTLRALAGDGQAPTTVCPREFKEGCSPHIAARLEGSGLRMGDLITTARTLAISAPGDLLLETAGGVLSPQADDGTAADLVAAIGWPAMLVTRPDLGAISAVCAAVEACRSRKIELRAVIISHVLPDDGSVAVKTAAEEITRWARLPVVAELRHAGSAAEDAKDADAIFEPKGADALTVRRERKK